MKKYWRTLVLATIFIAVLIYMGQNRSHDGDLHLWDLETSQLSAIAIKRGKERVHLERQGGHWHWREGDEFIPLDDEKWSWRLNGLLHSHADSRLELDGQDFSARERYGLDASPDQLTFYLQTGQRQELTIGDRTPLQRHYYVQIPGKSAIFLLPISTVAPLLQVELSDIVWSESTELPANTPAAGSPSPVQSPPQ